MIKCKYTRDSRHDMYTPECCLWDEYPSTAVHEEDITEWTYCPFCSEEIQAYTNGRREALEDKTDDA